MSRISVVAALLGIVLVAGCKDMHCPFHKKSTTQAAMADCCSMCDGVQTATADGKCPKCGMKVKS